MKLNIDDYEKIVSVKNSINEGKINTIRKEVIEIR